MIYIFFFSEFFKISWKRYFCIWIFFKFFFFFLILKWGLKFLKFLLLCLILKFMISQFRPTSNFKFQLKIAYFKNIYIKKLIYLHLFKIFSEGNIFSQTTKQWHRQQGSEWIYTHILFSFLYWYLVWVSSYIMFESEECGYLIVSAMK